MKSIFALIASIFAAVSALAAAVCTLAASIFVSIFAAVSALAAAVCTLAGVNLCVNLCGRQRVGRSSLHAGRSSLHAGRSSQCVGRVNLCVNLCGSQRVGRVNLVASRIDLGYKQVRRGATPRRTFSGCTCSRKTDLVSGVNQIHLSSSDRGGLLSALATVSAPVKYSSRMKYNSSAPDETQHIVSSSLF